MLLQSECERLSREAAKLQHRSADSANAETDASRDWRIRSSDGLQQPQQKAGTNSIAVVTEGFILPHDVEQLQERVLELERANRILCSVNQHVRRSPASTDQDTRNGGFIDEQLRLEALQTRTRAAESFVSDSAADPIILPSSRDDAEISPVISPVPSPGALSGSAESHSPAYERLKAEFVAYKQKAQKDYAKLKTRLVSVVREYNELRSSGAVGRSRSLSPVLWSSISPVADILASQSMLREQMSPTDRRHSTSSWHCKEEEVQTDLCDIGRNVDSLVAPVLDSQIVKKTMESQPSEVVQDTRLSSVGMEMDSTASVRDRCSALEMELLAVRSQYSTLMQENASLTKLVGRLRKEVEKREWPAVTEAPAAAASDGSTTDGNYQSLVSENERLRQERSVNRAEYEEKLQQLEDRCVQEYTRLRQLLSDIKAGSDRPDEVGDGDSSSSCRRCADLAEKCRVLEMSAELSSLNAERRLQEAEESRSVASRLMQSHLDQMSEDAESMVSETYAGSDNLLLSCVADNHTVTNTSVADRQGVVCDGLFIDKTISSTDRVTLPVCTVGDNLVQQPFLPSCSDVDLEVAAILEPKHENVHNAGDGDLTLYETVDNDDDLSTSFVSCEDLNDEDCKMSLNCQYSLEFNDAVSLQAHYETSAMYDSRQPSAVEVQLAEYETERPEGFMGVSEQYFVTETQHIIQEDPVLPQYSTEAGAVEQKPQKTTSLSDCLAETSSGKMLGNFSYNGPLVKNVNGYSSVEQSDVLLSDSVNSCQGDSLNRSDVNPSQIQVEDVRTEIIKEQEQAAVAKEDTVTSCTPPGATSSAVMLESVAQLVSQNEQILRRNQAWTEKLKHEYAAAADELRTMKHKYENIASEKEKVPAHFQLASEDIKPGGPSIVKPAAVDRRATGSSTDTPDASAELPSSVCVELELLRLEKSELCASLEMEEQKTAELQRQQSELVSSMRLLEVRSSELEEQLSSARIQLEIVLKEKTELCRRYGELEADGMTQTDGGGIASVQDNSVDADSVSNATESIVPEEVANGDSDASFTVQLDIQQLAAKVHELEIVLELATAEKLGFQEQLEHSQEECRCLVQKVEQLTGQLDSVTKSSEDALHDAMNELQELTAVNSSLEMTNSSLTNELQALKSRCCGSEDEASRLTVVAESLQLELESTKQLLNQRCEELLSKKNSTQQHVACLEEENAHLRATWQSISEKNEQLLVELADVRRDCEGLSYEKEKLSAENSAVESAKSLLEEQCSKLTEKVQQLEFTAAEARQQHDASLQDLRSALDHKQKEWVRLSEETEAAKLSAELNALKLHDSLKCSEQQLQQLLNAETVIKDLEAKLSDKQNEVKSVSDLHASALLAVDEATSQLVSLQSENNAISAMLSELRVEKDQLIIESATKVETLEAELLRKTAEMSSLREKAVQIEAANEQLVVELQSVNTALHETQHQLQEAKLCYEKQVNSYTQQVDDERASLKVACDAHSAELEQVTLKYTSVELQLSAVKTENGDIRQEIEQAREEIQKWQDVVNTMQSEYQQYKDDAETQLTEVKSVRDGLVDNLADCRQEKKEVEEKLNQLAGEFESCKGEMAAVIEEIVIFKQCNDELKLRIAHSQNNEENLAGELWKLREEHAKSCALHRTEMDGQKEMVLRAEKERDDLRSIHEQSCQVIDDTIAKYTEVEAQLSQLRQTNNMLVCDLDKSNQRCTVLSSENERLLSDNREFIDSLSNKSKEIGLLGVENEMAEAKIIKLSSELKALNEQLYELVSKESALQEEAKELKCANSQLHLELEKNKQLSQKLDNSHKHVEEIESELGEWKTIHRMSLDREEKLMEEIRLLTMSRDGLVASLQSDSESHHLQCKDLKSQVEEMDSLLAAAQDSVSHLQMEKQDVENVCKLLHECIADCILEVLRDKDTEPGDEGIIPKEISENDDVEQLNWLQTQISRKNNQLLSLHNELKTCRECLSSEESLCETDKKLVEKLDEECKRLEDELTARSRRHEESSKQHAAAVSALQDENDRLSEDRRILSGLQSSSQQNVMILTEEITSLKSMLQQLEETNAKTEEGWKMQECQFNSLSEEYNILIAEKNALEMENRSLSDQMEVMQKGHLDLETRLSAAHGSNCELEEKLSQAVLDLQQSVTECSAHCIKISDLEESLSSENCRNRKLADSLENYRTLFDEISNAVTSISHKCQSDYPDAVSADEVDKSHSECAGDVLGQYSNVLPSLDLISNCCRQVIEEWNQQKEKIAALVAECDFLRAQASVDMSIDVGLQELQDEVARLFQAKTDLENEVMQLRAESVEARDSYDSREAELAAEKDSLEQKLTDLHHLLDMASQSKEALETELLCERNEFERNLAAARCESLLRAGRSEEEQRKIVEQLSDSEGQLAGLRDRLRASQDERELLQLRLAYVTRECTVKEQHLNDLRSQVAAQHTHIEEAKKEHRNTIQLLVELRVEQQLGRREQRGDISRLEEEILRLESHIESCSSRVGTPQTMSLLSAPVSHQPSSVHSLPVNSTHQTDEDIAVNSGHDQTMHPPPDDLAYKALETKHFQLVQELSELKQQLFDLQEANKCLTNENVVLKQHVEPKTPDSSVPDSASLCKIHERKSSVDFSRKPYRVQSCEQFSSIGSATSLASVDQRFVGINIPVEMVSLQAKLVRLQKDYQELVTENSELRTNLVSKQDELMKQMEIVRDKQKKRSFRFGPSSLSENVAAMTEVSGQQIELLRKERDELRCRLDAARVKEDEAARLSDRVEHLEDALNKERQKFHELYQAKESIEIELLREQLTVEKHVREFQQLQGLVSKRDRIEQQLHQTSSASVPDSTSSAGTRQILQDKKTQLVVEIRRKILYRDVALQVGDSSLRAVRRTQVSSVQPTVKRPPSMAAERSLRLDCGCVTELGTMRMRAGCRYHQAVERLRRELKAQDAVARKTGKHAGIH